MSDDLIKDEAEFIRICATDIETGEPLDDDEMCNMYVIDAHRIADLIDAVEERNKELTLQLLAAHGQAADALDKLAKAVEALRVSLEGLNWAKAYLSTGGIDSVEVDHADATVYAALAELEGGGERDQKQGG
jgi:protein-L-isoaspartate O-methyltransferase